MIPNRLARAAAATLALLVSATAAPAAVFNPETFTLENGLQVIVVPNHRIPAVTHMIWYRVGAADEPPGKSGIAHYLEHLMFKGTKTVPNGEFSRLVAQNGGRENAFTSQDYTAYYQTVAVDRLELVMRLEADRMVNLDLTPEKALPERDVILEERRQRIENNPAALLGERVRSALFMNHPYRKPIIGWPQEIAKLTLDDALDFYRRYYAPNNAILVVGGDITAEELKPLAEKYYGVIPAREVPARVRPQEPPHFAPARVTLTSDRVRSPSWMRSYLAPSYRTARNGEAYALQVLEEILGGSATSRLYRSLVVEQKIAVSAGAGYGADDFDSSTFEIYARPRPGGDVAEVEAAVEREIAALLEDGVSEEEVARAKKRLVTAAVYARDSLQSGARIFGRALASGRTVEDVESWPERIDEVTADQVNAAARAVLVIESSVTGVLLPAPPGDGKPVASGGSGDGAGTTTGATAGPSQ